MQPSNACYGLIKQFEGCRLTAYPDPATGGDPWTIGYGHTGPEVHKGLSWTTDKAQAVLQQDVDKVAAQVNQVLGGTATTQAQFDAMVSFTYNLGSGNFASSTLLKKHRAGDYDAAADEFLRWNKAAGKVMAGLTNRRDAERDLYRGEY